MLSGEHCILSLQQLEQLSPIDQNVNITFQPSHLIHFVYLSVYVCVRVQARLFPLQSHNKRGFLNETRIGRTTSYLATEP